MGYSAFSNWDAPSNTVLGYTHGHHGFEALGIGVRLWHSHRHNFWE